METPERLLAVERVSGVLILLRLEPLTTAIESRDDVAISWLLCWIVRERNPGVWSKEDQSAELDAAGLADEEEEADEMDA